MNRRLLKNVATGLSAALLVAASGLALGEIKNVRPTLNLRIDKESLNRDVNSGNSFAPIVKKVQASVVKVFVTAASGRTSPMNNDEMDQFRRFFGIDPDQNEEPSQKALGSGVVVSPDGYILTNNHVVDRGKQIQIALNDGRSYNARVVGTDPQTDVALLKVEAKDLPVITLTDSDSVEVGDTVLAIGNPFGIGTTVTKGIVSAKNRVMGIIGEGDGGNGNGGNTSVDRDEDFIQTDAPINPGNSGGALVDTEGRLVGINTAILSRTGGNQGIGFAVPANLCRWVVDSIITNGKVERGFLGIKIQDLTPDLAHAFKLDRTNGALVSEVNPNSPASQAGLKNGDVVLTYNGKEVQDSNQLKVMVAETTPGSNVPLGVSRSGDKLTVNVGIKERSGATLAKNEVPKTGGDDALTGVSVSDLTPRLRSQLGVPNDLEGAVISDVDRGSSSYDAGLRPGDVITEINNEQVKTAQDAVNKTTHRSGNQTLVKFWSRGRGYGYLAVKEGG